jgi:hypothetical protein
VHDILIVNKTGLEDGPHEQKHVPNTNSPSAENNVLLTELK